MSNVPNCPGVYRLIKSNVVIYVGSAVDLLRRFNDWCNDPENVCVKRQGFDVFSWQSTSSLEEARRLELEWYNTFRPICNLVSPSGRA